MRLPGGTVCWTRSGGADSSHFSGFAQKILGGHRPPLQLGVRNCRGALLSARDVFFVQSPLLQFFAIRRDEA